jgi:ribosomal protein S18 acetylase RimI-like enzyme
MIGSLAQVTVRNTRSEDFQAIIEMTRQLYPDSKPWSETQLASHLLVFPEGQFVAIDFDSGRVVGMAASLIVSWDDYDMKTSWRDFTDYGMFTNHDSKRGRTLYAADVMVGADCQGRGVGTRLYEARRDLVRQLRLRRIRSGARLRGYHRHADSMSAEEYAFRVAQGVLWDPTVSFQLRRGFHILAVVPGYLRNDRESLGYAAVIEWMNPEVATADDQTGRDRRFDRGDRPDSPASRPPAS